MFKELLFSQSGAASLGYLILRAGVGALFALHGWPKLIHGVETWRWMGEQLGPWGIHFAPVVWGFIAMMAEFGGGICLVLGFATRPASFLLACVMVVAISYHLHKGDPYDVYSHPLTLLVVMICIFLTGPGNVSLDHCIMK